MMRASGILLPVFSLPSPYGIGCFSEEAYEFVDFLKRSGQTYWQILPLGPTSYGDSPYQSFSTFAGNPYYIDLWDLVERGWLSEEEVQDCDFGEDVQKVSYGKLYENRFALLRKAYERSHVAEAPAFGAFVQEQSYWIHDYALFMAVKDYLGGGSWITWPEDIRYRWQNALDYYNRELYFDIEYYKFMQYLFYKQWGKLKEYANEKGIQIIGDIPIYVAFDSADVWSHPELFQLKEGSLPAAVAGCPPDGFSAAGQLWGNPLYRWEYHRETGYDWWVRRVAHCCKLYDLLRIDHFRGFDEYYSIPAEDDTAVNGHWEKGPGIDLFLTIKERLGEKAIIAEDLGYMTDSVRQLVKDSGYPGMKVLEFAFDSRDSSSAADYLPHNYTNNCVVYTGTHDNETVMGWLDSILPEERKLVEAYVGRKRASKAVLCSALIRSAMSSVADLCVIPLQDYLGLGNEARINHPSTSEGNWQWRMKKSDLSRKLEKNIAELTSTYGR